MIASMLSLMLAATFAADQPSQAKARAFDKEHLQGTWHATSAQGLESELAKQEVASLALTFRGDTFSARYGAKSVEGTFKLDPVAVPQAIDVTVTQGPEEVKGKTFHGIYLLEGNSLRVAFRGARQERPAEFVAKGQAKMYQLFLKRDKR